MDAQFFKMVYCQYSPKMTDGSLSTVWTINGDKVLLLDKITVPLHLDGCEYPCDFHVMQNLAFDAILGRNFLQENRALIDLQRSSATFKGTGYPGKQTRSLRDAVMGSFLSQIPQKKHIKERKVVTAIADLKSLKTFEPQNVSQNQKCKYRGFQWPVLVLRPAVLYLLPVSHTPLTQHNDEPIPVQKLPQFLKHGAPDEINQADNVLGTQISQVDIEKFAYERKLQNVRVLKSATPFKRSGDVRKTTKPVYSSKENRATYHNFYRDEQCPPEFQDEQRDVLYRP